MSSSNSSKAHVHNLVFPVHSLVNSGATAEPKELKGHGCKDQNREMQGKRSRMKWKISEEDKSEMLTVSRKRLHLKAKRKREKKK